MIIIFQFGESLKSLVHFFLNLHIFHIHVFTFDWRLFDINHLMIQLFNHKKSSIDWSGIELEKKNSKINQCTCCCETNANFLKFIISKWKQQHQFEYFHATKTSLEIDFISFRYHHHHHHTNQIIEKKMMDNDYHQHHRNFHNSFFLNIKFSFSLPLPLCKKMNICEIIISFIMEINVKMKNNYRYCWCLINTVTIEY